LKKGRHEEGNEAHIVEARTFAALRGQWRCTLDQSLTSDYSNTVVDSKLAHEAQQRQNGE